jgi:hypothetical protein
MMEFDSGGGVKHWWWRLALLVEFNSYSGVYCSTGGGV